MPLRPSALLPPGHAGVTSRPPSAGPSTEAARRRGQAELQPLLIRGRAPADHRVERGRHQAIAERHRHRAYRHRHHAHADTDQQQTADQHRKPESQRARLAEPRHRGTDQAALGQHHCHTDEREQQTRLPRTFGANIPGRNGGLALALYDPRGDRHRWLLFTRDCLQGTSIYWLAAGSGLAIGYAASDHPVYAEEGRDGLFALDLTNARAYRLLLAGAALLWELPEAQDEQGRLTPGQPPPKPGDVGEPAFEPSARQIGRLRKDPTTLRTRCGASVPLSAIRTAIDAGVSLQRQQK